jgi:hypothetical protein
MKAKQYTEEQIIAVLRGQMQGRKSPISAESTG